MIIKRCSRKFDFLKEKENQYRLDLVKIQFKESRFEAFIAMVTHNGVWRRCDLLYFDLQNEGGFDY
jgi:hypothetical protein